jgi:hypothetical protein
LLHGLLERYDAGLCVGIVFVCGRSKKHSDPPHPLFSREPG